MVRPRCQWLMPVILAAEEAEIKRITKTGSVEWLKV
jgi:hypothetical protein